MKSSEPPNSNLEMEEGEIVDEFELISSDEEAGMRMRIRELEEKNAEIEFISQISRSYDIERAAKIPTDVSSISSTEFKTPKKRKRHKNKEHKGKCHRHHSNSSAHHRHHSTQIVKKSTSSRSRKTRCKRREKLLRKKHAKYAYRDYGGDRLKLALDSPDSLESDFSTSLSESEGSLRFDSANEDYRDDYHYSGDIRDTLRLAVSRHRKNSTRQNKHKNGLKEKLMRRDEVFSEHVHHHRLDDKGINLVEEDDVEEICQAQNENIHNVPEDSSDSMEERELRLIALKSAVLKKHMERKKRNAEAAYSPTDFDEIIMPEEKLDDIEVIDLEEDEDSQNACATVSPIASPQLMLLDGQDDSSQIDCKPVDMDIANSDSEDANDNCWGVVPMPQSVAFPNFAQHDNIYSYGNSDYYINDFPLNTSDPPPPPPGVDDYEDIKPPVLIYNEKYLDSDAQDMELENEFEPIESYPSQNENIEPISVQEIIKKESNEVDSSSKANEEDLQEEEEEMALRALLLAKFQSPKNQKKTALVETNKSKNEDVKPAIPKPTEAILKEAVKRLQIHSQIECRHDTNLYEGQIKSERVRSRPQSCEPPLQKRSDFVHLSQDNSRDSESLALVTLQRKAKQLKSSCESKEKPKHHDVANRSQDNDLNVLEKSGSRFANSEVRELSSQNYVDERIEYNGYYPWEKSASRETDFDNRNHFEDRNEIISSHNSEFDHVHLREKGEKSSFAKHKSQGETVFDPELQNQACVEERATAKETSCNNDQKEQIPLMDEDIKRRLQKLKDEILSATKAKSLGTSQDCNDLDVIPALNENEQKVPAKSNQKSSVPQEIDEPCIPKATVKSQELPLAIEKTITEDRPTKPPPSLTNLIPTNQKNKEASKTNSALKENNVNSVNKKQNTPKGLKDEQPAIKKATKTTTKSITSTNVKEVKLDPTKAIVISRSAGLPNTVPQMTVTSTVKPTPLPTYSVLRTTKIVKPNKVINRNVDTKRKVILIKSEQNSVQSQAPPTKQIKLDTSTNIPASKSVDNSRLITSMDQVKHMCNVAQLVISVQNSSNESSDEEWANCDSLYKPLIDYNDNASPLSLNMESPCLTPIRSQSPIDIDQQSKGVNEESANKRSPITVKTSLGKTLAPKTPNIAVTNKKEKAETNLKTPVAVRHLPPAAQDEYRQLVHRMKLLENQRNKKETSSASENNSNNPSNSHGTAIETKLEKETTKAQMVDNKSSLVKKVLLRNASKPTTTPAVVSNEKSSTPNESTLQHHSKAHKTDVLRSYENLYAKIGSGIVNNLDKSLKLVEEAKKAKVNKLKLEERIKQLKAEMELLQSKHKEEEQKISRIYPTICSTNEVITSLKQKRSKVFKAAVGLGKTLKGEDYRLNNDLKQNIISKTKLLATEIKVVNSLKAENLKTLTEENGELTEKKGAEEHVEESKTVDKETTSNNPNQTTTTTSPAINETPQTTHEEVTTTSEASKEETGGTTEFQDNGDDDDVPGDAMMAKGGPPNIICDTNSNTEYETICSDKLLKEKKPNATEEEDEANCDAEKDTGKSLLPSYISPLEHIRCSNEGTLDPNGVICPYDLMGNCEDVNCKYVHISQQQDNKKKQEQQPEENTANSSPIS
ncbi:uncharacterized protein isoform X2 [Musca autumnalis]|uniref:uncharacterized protein isoform X2 n=1 Tax=Musca autumnalis TaxID=221902 RepID=UPI003CF01C81